MELKVMLLIMLFMGFIGGLVNYLLPSNRKEDGTLELNFKRSIFLGIGATLLVPIFLNTVDSQLMDDIKINSDEDSTRVIVQEKNISKQFIATLVKNVDSIAAKNNVEFLKKNSAATKNDSKIAKKNSTKSTNNKSSRTITPVQEAKDGDKNTGKKYLLWAAYCALAAMAGFKFIEFIIKNVLREQEVKNLKHENVEKGKELDKANAEKEKKEVELQKRKKMTVANLVENEAEIKNEIEINFNNTEGAFKQMESVDSDNLSKPFIMPVLPAIMNLDDPQKGRFGGKSEVNDRKISAVVKETTFSDFFNVTITVAPITNDNPIISETYFYLHDTFLNPIRKVSPQNGEVVLADLLSYGAFTVGVITDFGQTVLELDLAEGNFPKKFKEN